MARKKTETKKPAAKAKRTSWLDKSSHPLIEQYARQLDSFVDALADGKVEASEIKAQETRLVGLMKEIEPQLNNDLHEKVTRLLCELTAYDLMLMINAIQEARPKTRFRG
jgi:hypothetical protein